MKRFTIIAIFILLVAVASTFAAESTADGDVDAVRKIIENAYVKGIHIESDIPAIRKGFHESFTMMIKKDGKIRAMSIAEWISAIEKRKKQDPSPPKHKTEWKIPVVDVVGDAAIARVEIFRDGRHIYSDYMSLYRFEDGWKIVAKIYYDHRQD